MKPALTCQFKDAADVPCGAPVPSKNDHSGKEQMSFIAFATHGLCARCARRMRKGMLDPGVLKYLFTSGESRPVNVT